LALKFGTNIINIDKLMFQKFNGKKIKFQSLEGVKVGSIEFFLSTTYVARF